MLLSEVSLCVVTTWANKVLSPQQVLHLIKKLYAGKHAWNTTIIGNDVWSKTGGIFLTSVLIKVCSLVFQTDRPLTILSLAGDKTMQKFVNSILVWWTSCELFTRALLTASVDLCTAEMVWIHRAKAG